MSLDPMVIDDVDEELLAPACPKCLEPTLNWDEDNEIVWCENPLCAFRQGTTS